MSGSHVSYVFTFSRNWQTIFQNGFHEPQATGGEVLCSPLMLSIRAATPSHLVPQTLALSSQEAQVCVLKSVCLLGIAWVLPP